MPEPLLIKGFFAPNCSSRDDTLALINKIVGQLAPETEIKAITVNSGDEAKELCFLGSPSIHINGKDIEPGSEKRNDYSLS